MSGQKRVTTLEINESWREYAGMWNPSVYPWVADLDPSKCYAPRISPIPPVAQCAIPASGKLEYNFHLTPGSMIWGITPPIESVLGGGAPTSIQLTDVGVGHQLFQEPVTPEVLEHITSNGADTEDFTLLPCPWPITGNGLFTFEAWGDPTTKVLMLLFIAEVVDCPVH